MTSHTSDRELEDLATAVIDKATAIGLRRRSRFLAASYLIAIPIWRQLQRWRRGAFARAARMITAAGTSLVRPQVQIASTWSLTLLRYLAPVALGLAIGAAGVRAITDLPGFKGDLELFRDSVLLVAQTLAVLMLIALFGIVLAWLSRDEPGIRVAPFENATGDERLGNIADALVVEIERIRDLAEAQLEGVRNELLNLPRQGPRNEDFSNLRDIGIGVGAADIPIGKVLLGLKQLWPVGRTRLTLSGSIHRYGGRLRLLARLESSRIVALDVEGPITDGSELPSLTRDLAYKAVWRIQRDAGQTEARNWLAFRHYYDAREAYARFFLGRQDEDKKAVTVFCEKALQADPKFTHPADLYRALAEIEVERDHVEEAGSLYRSALQVHRDAFAAVGAAIVDFRLGSYAEARTRIDKALSMPVVHPGLVSPVKGVGLAYTHFFRGVIFMRLWQPLAEAAPSQQSRVPLVSTSGLAQGDLVRVSDGRGQSEEHRILRLGSTWIDLDNSLGHYYLDGTVDELPEARDALQLARQMFEGWRSPLATLALCYFKLGDIEQHNALINEARPLFLDADTYERACFEAIAGNDDTALVLLREALADGVHPRRLKEDSALDRLRRDPRFQELFAEFTHDARDSFVSASP